MASLRRSLEKLMPEAPIIAKETKLKPDQVESVLEQAMIHHENHKRQPMPPAPEGGISLSGAGRKYGIPKGTLSRWCKKHNIPVLLRTTRELYVDEIRLAQLITEYQKDPGRGKRTAQQPLSAS